MRCRSLQTPFLTCPGRDRHAERCLRPSPFGSRVALFLRGQRRGRPKRQASAAAWMDLDLARSLTDSRRATGRRRRGPGAPGTRASSHAPFAAHFRGPWQRRPAGITSETNFFLSPPHPRSAFLSLLALVALEDPPRKCSSLNASGTSASGGVR